MCALEIETQCVEWKETWRDEYLKWICGFANAYGGVLTTMTGSFFGTPAFSRKNGR